ncbi:PEGA domain-containing protein [Patescibacteria group bacterium]
MAKIRILLFLISVAVVGTIGLVVSLYARGYRFNLNTLKFEPNGILVIKSDPDGARVYINTEFKTATNTTLSISPGTYDIEVKKDGFLPWKKRFTVEKEIVTQATASLFRAAPSLSAETFTGIVNPVASDDYTKIAYVVSPSQGISQDKVGLWVTDTFNLPIGFSREPKRITDGDLSTATFIFSPDNRQILLTTKHGVYLLDTGNFVSQAQRVNISSKKEETMASWKEQKTKKMESLIRNLPDPIPDILARKTSEFQFSPDESMIVYTASASANIPGNLITQLPGSSTQKQERTVQIDKTYVYDIKEDRNFLVADIPITSNSSAIRWFPTSRHLIYAEEGKITIMDYDSTNKQTVYSGSYIAPFAFPFTNSSKLLILTNLGAGSSASNLYSLNLK